MAMIPRSRMPALGCWLFAACLCAVLLLALMPPTGAPSTGWDKSNHFLAFGTLVVLGRRAFPGHDGLLLEGLLAFGILIEILQSFTPDRSADWADLVADAAAIAMVWSMDVVISRVFRQIRS